MDVTNRTIKQYTISNITEQQATDLLNLCVGDNEHVRIDILDPSIGETLNNMRQALLNAGVKRGDESNGTG